MAVLLTFLTAIFPATADDATKRYPDTFDNAVPSTILQPAAERLKPASDNRGQQPEPVSGERRRKYAVPVEKQGLGNFFKVNDGLYRGKQPTSWGIRELKKMGIKTILSLRSSHSDRELIDDAGLTGQVKYIRIKTKPDDPQDDEIVTFLKIAANPANQPVFVHCAHGSDRTGLMVAAYRMAVEGWSREEAIDEMINGGFGFHSVFREIPAHLRMMDVEQVRESAGLDGRDGGDIEKHTYSGEQRAQRKTGIVDSVTVMLSSISSIFLPFSGPGLPAGLFLANEL